VIRKILPRTSLILPRQQGRGTVRSMVEGAFTLKAAAAPSVSLREPPSPLAGEDQGVALVGR